MNSNCRAVGPAAHLTEQTPITAMMAENQSTEREAKTPNTLHLQNNDAALVDRAMYSSQLAIAGAPPARLGSLSFHRRKIPPCPANELEVDGCCRGRRLLADPAKAVLVGLIAGHLKKEGSGTLDLHCFIASHSQIHIVFG